MPGTTSTSRSGDRRDDRTRREHADWDALDREGKVHAVHTMTTAPIEGLQHENPPHDWDLRAAIACFEKPLLLAMASPGESINDDATLDDVSENHSAAVKLKTFAGAGHNLHRTDFEAFAATLDEFLSRDA
jgi:pimeloyl-ACP methyl ester carboxylesterase